MKLKLLFTVLFLQIINLQGQTLRIIPAPTVCEAEDGEFLAIKEWNLHGEKEHEGIVSHFSNQAKACGVDFPIHWVESRDKANLFLCKQDGKSAKGPESYSLDIKPAHAVLKFSDRAGLFYGLQTLIQLTATSRLGNECMQIPCVKIEDQPKFTWRGIMLDESRHFFGKEKVMQLIDWMAFYKLNRFHWHLTDASGWRIEILKYPKLTTVGGIGTHSNPLASAQYYTQKEIKEIIQYAGDRFIEVIPEIDMPGHATAANKAYPEYSGGGSEEHPEFTFNPGKEETYAFLTDVLREVANLFPSKYIHLGGDEVHFGNQQWNSNTYIQKLMKENHLGTLQEVEYYFINRMADSLSVLDKTMIGWDEVVNARIGSDRCVTMWWRHDKPEQLKKSLSEGYSTIMCPRIPLYFDFVQDSAHQSGRRWEGDFVTIEKILNFQEQYGEIISAHPDQIIGLQANIWTETIHSSERLEFMTFPRIAAFSELAWNSSRKYDYEAFLHRLKPSLKLYEKMNIKYFDPTNSLNTREILGVEK